MVFGNPLKTLSSLMDGLQSWIGVHAIALVFVPVGALAKAEKLPPHTFW